MLFDSTVELVCSLYCCIVYCVQRRLRLQVQGIEANESHRAMTQSKYLYTNIWRECQYDGPERFKRRFPTKKTIKITVRVASVQTIPESVSAHNGEYHIPVHPNVGIGGALRISSPRSVSSRLLLRPCSEKLGGAVKYRSMSGLRRVDSDGRAETGVGSVETVGLAGFE